MMLLELKNVKKYFPLKKGIFENKKFCVKAVDQINLAIRAGENLSLVGESGSGKTTVARLALKLLAPDEGSIFWGGEDITHWREQRFRPFRRYIQMVFQDPYSSLDPRFTIRAILKEAMTLDQFKYHSAPKIEERLEGLLKAVNLSGSILDRYPHEFSGGERQRIAIARALVLNPKLLILDEAVSSLDIIIQEQLIKLLLSLQKEFNMTYLFISHNLKVVRKISHVIAVMYKGKIVEYGTTTSIFNGPLHPYTQQLLSAAFDYKIGPEKEFDLPPRGCLVDQGEGHWVLE